MHRLVALLAAIPLVTDASHAAAQPSRPNLSLPGVTAESLSVKAEVTRSAFTRNDVYLTGAFALGTLATAALDAKWGGRLQAPKVQALGVLRAGAKGADILGSPGAIVVSSALYAGGRLLKQRGLADAGLHATEAVVLSGMLTTVLKGVTGRARPNTPNSDPSELGPDADRFRFGRGFSSEGYTSFPSGHTTVAFAAASAFTRELSETHKRAAWIVGPLLYGGATAVGLSRMYDNKHWASDVVAGAAVGTLIGRTLVAHQHAHRGNRLDCLLLPNAVEPSASGVSMRWSLPVR